MKINLLFIICFLQSWVLTLGQNCILVNQSVINQNPVGLNYYNCVDLNGVVAGGGQISPTNYDILSATSVKIDGESYLFPGIAAASRVIIETSPIEITQISPSSLSVPKYEKLEFSIGLPELAENRIMNFVYETPNSQKLNPFDPLDVDIQAVFQWKTPSGWVTKGKQYGFYYKEYVYDTSSLDHNTWHRDEVVLDELFRVRYSPPSIGDWRVYFIVNLNGVGNYITPNYHFNVVESDNLGYMKVAEGGKYFQVGNDVFYPIGQNQPYPECVSEYCLGIGYLTDPNAQWSGEQWRGDERSPIKSYTFYHKVMEKMKEGGANYFRLLTNQWGLDIEYEKLGNYYDRMPLAWEMDIILDKAHELDLKMTWNMFLHTPLEYPNVNTTVDWDFKAGVCGDRGWCYSTIPGVNTPIDVFTNQTAKRYFKNKLRYFVARYGYSTSVGLMELVSEINNVGQGHEMQFINGICEKVPNGEIPNEYESNITIVQNWQIEMLDYIKNGLGHMEHLTGVSYAGTPRPTDLIYYSPLVDYIGFNNYSQNLDRYISIHNAYDTYRNSGLNKPMFNAEIGAGGELLSCENKTDWIKNIWVMPFTGFAGAGMNWSNMYHLGFDKMNSYGHLNNFLQDVDFRDESGIIWAPVFDVRNDKKSETYAMRGDYDNNKHKAIGVILNRSYNYFTNGAPSSICTELSINDLIDRNFDSFNMSPLDVAYEEAPNRLKLNNMGVWITYSIEWYNCWTGQLISQTEKTSDILGSLYLEHPLLSGDDSSPLIAYKINRTNQSKSSLDSLGGLNSNLIGVEVNMLRDEGNINYEQKIDVFPNPVDDVFFIKITDFSGNSLPWVLMDLNGKRIQAGTFSNNINTVFTSDLISGVYILKVYIEKNNVEVFKVVKL